MEKTSKKTCDNIRVLDPVTQTPEWLKVTVDKALPGDSLNVWIPTNDLSTSSLIRIPRFPSVRLEADTVASPFDIHPVDLSGIHVISGVRNEQQSFQVAVASKKDITGLSAELQALYRKEGIHWMQNALRSGMSAMFPCNAHAANWSGHLTPKRYTAGR